MYFLSEAKTNYYFTLLESNNDNLIRLAYQEMVWSFDEGIWILPSYRDRLFQCLEEHVISQSPKVRKWALHITCTYCNSDIISKLNIIEEPDDEVRSWMLATIAANTNKEYLSAIVKKDLGLNYQVIELCTQLYSKYHITPIDQQFINKALNSSDFLIKDWLTFAYKYRFNANRKNIIIPKSTIVSLTGHDNVEIQEYAVSAIWKYCPDFSFDSDLAFPYHEISKLNKSVEKWALTCLGKDKSFIRCNYDFIKEKMNDVLIAPKSREGLARGIMDYGYDSNLVYEIIIWYTKESDIATRTKLIEYMSKNYKKDKTGIFFQCLNDEIANSKDETEKTLINHYLSNEQTQKNITIYANNNLGREKFMDISKKIFVVHGRNEKIRRAMFSFLRSVGLEPIEWSEAKSMTRKGSPYIGEILESAFKNAQAILVLFTPDDEAKLKNDYLTDTDETYEKTLTPQARPNVIFEAGMSFGYCADRTILVEVGKLRPFSDLAGRHLIHFTGTPKSRMELIQVMKTVGLSVQTDGKIDYLNEGDFTVI